MVSVLKDNYEKLSKKEISCKKLYKKSYIKFLINKNLNFMITTLKPRRHIFKDINIDNFKPKYPYLYNQPYVLKDNISTADITTTGGSLFLEDYVPNFNAEVQEILSNAGGVLFGKSNLDEFGLGGTGTFSAFGIVKNPVHKKYIPGGSSSGSAVAVATGVVPYAIGTDTGDSIRKPASYTGIVGYKPSYGYISRYGVFPYAPSLDHVGIFARYVTDVSIVSQALVKFDEKDFTSVKCKEKFSDTLNIKKKLVIGYIPDFEFLMNSNIFSVWEKFKNIATQNNVTLVKIFPKRELLKFIDYIYKIISYSEANSCYSNLTGIPFGKKVAGRTYEEVIINSRTKYFGKQLKRRFAIGVFATLQENYESVFLKSKKIRRLLVEDFKNIFNEQIHHPRIDCIVSLGASDFAPMTKAILQNKIESNLIDDYLQVANFGGFPSITIPFEKNYNKLPIGINFMGRQSEDTDLLDVAFSFEQMFAKYNK